MTKSKYSILFEDDALVVVAKSAGLLSVPDRFDDRIENLKHLLRDRYGDILVVHRLDRDTSGVMVFAKDKTTQRVLSQQFEQQQVQKTYLALVHGQAPEVGTIDQPLAPDPGKAGRMLLHAKGKLATTLYERESLFGSYSLLGLYPKTGRTHQLRVHLKGIGHPIVADPIYGDGEAFFLSSLKGKKYRMNRTGEERPLLNRLALHAFELAFTHPVTKEKVAYKVDLPKDMRAVVKQLEKWGG